MAAKLVDDGVNRLRFTHQQRVQRVALGFNLQRNVEERRSIGLARARDD